MGDLLHKQTMQRQNHEMCIVNYSNGRFQKKKKPIQMAKLCRICQYTEQYMRFSTHISSLLKFFEFTRCFFHTRHFPSSNNKIEELLKLLYLAKHLHSSITLETFIPSGIYELID